MQKLAYKKLLLKIQKNNSNEQLLISFKTDIMNEAPNATHIFKNILTKIKYGNEFHISTQKLFQT